MQEPLEHRIDGIVDALVAGRISSDTALHRLEALDGIQPGRAEYIVRSLESVDVLQLPPGGEELDFTPDPSVWSAPETQITMDLKIGRNESCPCGSGQKFKKRCGK